MRGKTIQVFLTDGTPRGIKIADITSNIEQAVFIPRNKMKEAQERKEVYRPGLYFLLGENESSSKPLVYIGQSRNVMERIKTHDQKKDFWNYAVMIVSKTESFTQTHIEYLEQLAIQKAAGIGRFKLENSANPKAFSIPETLEADLLDNFDTIKILLSTLGFTVFESLKKEPLTKGSDNKEIFFCKGKIADAKGEYQEDGFVVYKHSLAAKELKPSAGDPLRNQRSKLIADKILIEKGDSYEFQEDFLFNSPSAAASQVLGRSANGWRNWRDHHNLTLDQVKRKDDAS
ncbi:GIY-YIG nuclease family protein [Persicobacter sp. CCB-QB2]|uniref:GIY-YIG nuclease family protein n=1 Tax=Persicobacter sp. CCB-QB2 TaxID=1561025 RepID=UPI0006A9AD92|nr:GIY-YIG nuclease family protein [Persicobacter sp. CCB-QB2]